MSLNATAQRVDSIEAEVPMSEQAARKQEALKEPVRPHQQGHLLAIVIGIIYMTAGIGFFPGKGWAWALGIIVSAVTLIDSVVEHPAAHAYGIPGAIVAIIIIFYLTRPSMKAFFRRN